MLLPRLVAACAGAILLAAPACSSDPAPGVDGGQGGGLRCTPGDTRSCEGAEACESEATQTCFATGEGWSTCACRRPSVGGSGGGGNSVGAGGSENNGGSGVATGGSATSPGGASGAAGACSDCSSCGDGVLDEGERCDDAGESPECNADCTHAECGDDVVNTSAGERCEQSLDAACDQDCQWGPLHYLVHRYGFEGSGTDLTDSVGSATGEVVNTTLSGTGVLLLAGGNSDQVVRLPNGMVSALTNATFEIWASWAGGDPWQRLFDFGSYTTQGRTTYGETWLMLTPLSGTTDVLRVDFAVNGWGSETADATRVLDVGVQSHVVVVVDDEHDLLQLYLNGILESEVGFAGSLSMLDDVNNMIGGSQFDYDADLGGVLDEFRIYDVALPPEWIQDNYEAGPNP